MPRISSRYHGPVRRACRDVPRSRSATARALVAAFLVVACGAAPTAVPSLPASGLAAKAPVRARWELASDVATWAPVRAPFPSRGHSAGFVVDVRVPRDDLAAYRALVRGQSLRPGFVVAASHRDAGTGAPGDLYAMTKSVSGNWAFVVASPDGSVVARGALSLCVGCHAEAPTDFVFTAGPAAPGETASKTPE